MIKVKVVPLGTNQNTIKKKLEKAGYRAAEYWVRFKRVTPAQLLELANLGKISAVRVETGKGARFRTYYYYLERQVDKAVKIMYPKPKKR